MKSSPGIVNQSLSITMFVVNKSSSVLKNDQLQIFEVISYSSVVICIW